MEFIYDKPKYINKERIESAFKNHSGLLLSFDGFEKDKYPFYTLNKENESIKLIFHTFFSRKVELIVEEFKDRDFLEFFKNNFNYDGNPDKLIPSTNSSIFYELSEKNLKLIQSQKEPYTENTHYFLIDELELNEVKNVEFLEGSIVFSYKNEHTLIIEDLDKNNAIYLYRVMKNNFSEVF